MVTENEVIEAIEWGLREGWIVPVNSDDPGEILFVHLDNYNKQFHGKPVSLGAALEYCQAERRKNNVGLN